MHFLSKNYSCCPKKALFCPESSKKCVNRDKSYYRNKIAYVSAWNFLPCPYFLVKALCAFAQLLSPCLKVRLIVTILHVKQIHLENFPFGKFCCPAFVIVVTNIRCTAPAPPGRLWHHLHYDSQVESHNIVLYPRLNKDRQFQIETYSYSFLNFPLHSSEDWFLSRLLLGQ